MTRKTTLPLDLENAMTAFQINPGWYEEYWLRPEDVSDLTSAVLPRLAGLFRKSKAPRPEARAIRGFGCVDICRTRDGSIDVDYYRRKAELERQHSRRNVVARLATALVRIRLFITSKLAIAEFLPPAEQRSITRRRSGRTVSKLRGIGTATAVLLTTISLLSLSSHPADATFNKGLRTLVATEIEWIAARQGWKATPAALRVTNESKLTRMTFGDAGTYKGAEPFVLYSFRDHNVYVSGSMNLTSTRARSVLVRELVHHLQVSNDVSLPCRSAYDAQAYQLQAEWLREQNVTDRYAIVGLDDWQIEELAECPW